MFEVHVVDTHVMGWRKKNHSRHCFYDQQQNEMKLYCVWSVGALVFVLFQLDGLVCQTTSGCYDNRIFVCVLA